MARILDFQPPARSQRRRSAAEILLPGYVSVPVGFGAARRSLAQLCPAGLLVEIQVAPGLSTFSIRWAGTRLALLPKTTPSKKEFIRHRHANATSKISNASLNEIGAMYDWTREVNTTDPEYYKWTQWIFVKMFKAGLAYKTYMPMNWCPSCKTGIANEDVVNGRCERCGTEVTKKRTQSVDAAHHEVCGSPADRPRKAGLAREGQDDADATGSAVPKARKSRSRPSPPNGTEHPLVKSSRRGRTRSSARPTW